MDIKFFEGPNVSLSIDPGSEKHGVIVFNDFHGIAEYKNSAISTNDLLKINGKFKNVIIENIDAIHGSVGHSTIETAINIGRFYQHFTELNHTVHLIGRTDIKKRLKCIDKKNGDKQVYEKMKELYPKCFDGKNPVSTSHWVPALAAVHIFNSL